MKTRSYLTKQLSRYSRYLFYGAILFFSIPNIYIFPSTRNAFLTTQSLARLLMLVIFFQILLQSFLLGKRIIAKQHHLVVGLMLVFFLTQSLSIFSAENLFAFIRRYKDVVLGLISFFIFYTYRADYKNILRIFTISMFVNLTYQTALYFYHNAESFFSQLIYSEHWKVVKDKLYQGKLYTETYDEAKIPFLFLYPTQSLLVLLYMAVISFLSNIRTRVVMLIIAVAGSLVFVKKISKMKIMFTLASLVVCGLIADRLSLYLFDYSYIERFTLQDEYQDTKTITSRFSQFQNAVAMGNTHLLGVGLGNYYDNLPTYERSGLSLSSNWKLSDRIGGTEYVHNIFGTMIAESGYISLIAFLVLIICFIRQDIHIIKQSVAYKKALVISFWTLFAFALFNPPIPGSFQVLFWGIRGMLLK